MPIAELKCKSTMKNKYLFYHALNDSCSDMRFFQKSCIKNYIFGDLIRVIVVTFFIVGISIHCYVCQSHRFGNFLFNLHALFLIKKKPQR